MTAQRPEEEADVERRPRTSRGGEGGGERAPGAREERAGGRRGQLEPGRDLVVPEPLPFAHHESTSLVRRQRGERLTERRDELDLVRDRPRERDPVDVDLRGQRPASAECPPLCVAHVPRDRRQPRELALGDDASAKRAQRVQERRLQRILRLGEGGEVTAAEPEDLGRMGRV